MGIFHCHVSFVPFPQDDPFGVWSYNEVDKLMGVAQYFHWPK